MLRKWDFNYVKLVPPSRRKVGRLRLKFDGTRAETRFRLSAKRTSPFKSGGGGVASVQSSIGNRGVRISGSNAGDTPCSEVVRRVLATHSIRQFPLSFPSRASSCAITFQLESTRQSAHEGGKVSPTHRLPLPPSIQGVPGGMCQTSGGCSLC